MLALIQAKTRQQILQSENGGIVQCNDTVNSGYRE
jgi:hypothetical protein